MQIIYEEHHRPEIDKYTNAFVTDGKNVYYYGCSGEYIRLGIDITTSPELNTDVRNEFKSVGDQTFTLTDVPIETRHMQVYVNGLLLTEKEYSLFGQNLNITKVDGPLVVGDKVVVLYSRKGF